MDLDQKLLDYISQFLISKAETISVAESVTSGCLQLAFSQMNNPSLFYKGGITTFTVAEKVHLLHLDETVVDGCDGVSEEVAETMALNAAKLFKTDWSISTAGYCSPVRSSCYKVYTFFSISYKGKIVCTKKLELHDKTQNLPAQKYYSEFILGCFKSQLTQSLMLD